MAARVKVRAVIWVGELIVVSRVDRRGDLHVTLPGGRVNEREPVTDALCREVLEEVGLDVEVGDLLFVAEVLTGPRRHDVELVFEAFPRQPVSHGSVDLVDPTRPDLLVLPPVLTEIARARACSERRASSGRRVWLGNVYEPGLRST